MPATEVPEREKVESPKTPSKFNTKPILRYLPLLLVSTALLYSVMVMRGIANDKIELEKQVLTSFGNIEREVNKLQAGISQNDIRRWNIIGVQKWITMVNTDLSDAVAYTYATSIVDEAERQKIDVALIASVATQESTFIYDAESTASAFGIMGIMPETGRWICKELGVAYTSETLKDPAMSIRIGTWFLNYLMKIYEEDEKLALAHYNGGNKQRNNYIQRRKYKHTEEFKLSASELRGKLLNLKVELIATGKNKHELRDDETYRYLDDVYAGKTFADETKEYIPDVLTRRDVIKKMLTKPTDTEEEMEAEEESTS